MNILESVGRRLHISDDQKRLLFLEKASMNCIILIAGSLLAIVSLDLNRDWNHGVFAFIVFGIIGLYYSYIEKKKIIKRLFEIKEIIDRNDEYETEVASLKASKSAVPARI